MKVVKLFILICVRIINITDKFNLKIVKKLKDLKKGKINLCLRNWIYGQIDINLCPILFK